MNVTQFCMEIYILSDTVNSHCHSVSVLCYRASLYVTQFTMATVSEVTTLPAEMKSTLDLGRDLGNKEAYLEKHDVASLGAGQVADSSNEESEIQRQWLLSR
jgi:hypothetical protein